MHDIIPKTAFELRDPSNMYMYRVNLYIKSEGHDKQESITKEKGSYTEKHITYHLIPSVLD